MLIHNHQLSAQQLVDLDRLCERCKGVDGHRISIYKHLLKQNRPVSHNLLYYHQKQLVGFISTFFFYEEACEISVMVDPSYRRQGIATQLMGEILPVLSAQRIATLIFSVPSETSTDWMLERGAIFTRREYQMQRQGVERAPVTNKAISVRLATATDEPILYAIDNACFPKEQSGCLSRFSELLQDANYKIFIVEKNKAIIGKAHLHFEAKEARLSDIAILPNYQGRGFGSGMLAYCINYSLAEHQSTLTLDVETTNQHALKLYVRLGFLITNACDFWSIPIEVLRLAKH